MKFSDPTGIPYTLLLQILIRFTLKYLLCLWDWVTNQTFWPLRRRHHIKHWSFNWPQKNLQVVWSIWQWLIQEKSGCRIHSFETRKQDIFTTFSLTTSTLEYFQTAMSSTVLGLTSVREFIVTSYLCCFFSEFHWLFHVRWTWSSIQWTDRIVPWKLLAVSLQ